MAVDLKTMTQSQLSDLIERARVRQNELEKEKVSKLRERIHALIQSEGLSVDDFFSGRSPGRAGRGKAKSTGFGTKVKPKYYNPLDPSQTWTGRGKRPRWFLAAIASGKSERDMLVEG